MWKCNNCSEENEDSFELCWKCGTESENINIHKESVKTFNYVPDNLSFSMSPGDNYEKKDVQKIIKDNENNDSNKKSYKSYLVIMIIFGIIIYFSGFIKRSNEKSNSNSESSKTQINNNPSDHISFVRNHFTSTGNDVYGINVLGKNGQNGYIIMVDGYNRKMAVSYQCTVKTDGTNGIVITDPGCDYTHQY